MKPYKIYAENIEQTALDQFHSAMEQDFVVQGALMPDAHTGYSLPIGAVVSTEGVVVPAWVGYDIGCGMCAVPTNFEKEAVVELAPTIFDIINLTVPLGFKHHRYDQEWGTVPESTEQMCSIFEARKGYCQLGTLGGGNHFIEIGADENGVVWIIVHSGSRGVGHSAATHYMRRASNSNKAKEGHYALRTDSQEGQDYITDLNFCQEFALENRSQIIQATGLVMSKVLGGGGIVWEDLINRNHNHAELKDGVWVHRKGATHAEAGMMGVIPGNMRDGSFIVRGKGNAESLCSSSHGAGRVMGRKAAERTLNVDEFITQMQGITANVGESTLDEAPGAYKDIFEVMELQKDLVEVVHHVLPILNVKG